MHKASHCFWRLQSLLLQYCQGCVWKQYRWKLSLLLKMEVCFTKNRKCMEGIWAMPCQKKVGYHYLSRDAKEIGFDCTLELLLSWKHLQIHIWFMRLVLVFFSFLNFIISAPNHRNNPPSTLSIYTGFRALMCTQSQKRTASFF